MKFIILIFKTMRVNFLSIFDKIKLNIQYYFLCNICDSLVENAALIIIVIIVYYFIDNERVRSRVMSRLRETLLK